MCPARDGSWSGFCNGPVAINSILPVASHHRDEGNNKKYCAYHAGYAGESAPIIECEISDAFMRSEAHQNTIPTVMSFMPGDKK
jgi:hypothetical protein